MKTKLITALRTAAKALEEDTFAYDWRHPESCNCGIIACCLTHKSIASLEAEIPAMSEHPSWRRILQHHCPVTGLANNAIIRSMQEAGMSQVDIIQLEDLSNPEVLKRVDVGTKKVQHKKRVGVKTLSCKEVIPRNFWQWITRQPVTFREVDFQEPIYSYSETEEPLGVKRDKKEHTILYMRAWADLLTEQGKEDAPEVQRQPTSSSANATPKKA